MISEKATTLKLRVTIKAKTLKMIPLVFVTALFSQITSVGSLTLAKSTI